MKKQYSNPWLVLSLFFVGAFCLGTVLVREKGSLSGATAEEQQLLQIIMGDSRKLFAGHFFTKADVYFHSGYYPTIFDNRGAFENPHMATDAGALQEKGGEHEHDFLGKPKDWIESLGRNFFPSAHTHLGEQDHHDHSHDHAHDHGSHHEQHHHDHGHNQEADKAAPANLSQSADIREILPWLRMATELDPQRVEAYTVTAFWLRSKMGKVDQAERVIRDGLQANPGNPAILFELGRIQAENHKDSFRARNFWEAALRNWQKQEAGKKEPDHFMLSQIALHLAQLEQNEGNFERSLAAWEIAKSVSPHPEEVQKRMDELRAMQQRRSAAGGQSRDKDQ